MTHSSFFSVIALKSAILSLVQVFIERVSTSEHLKVAPRLTEKHFFKSKY